MARGGPSTGSGRTGRLGGRTMTDAYVGWYYGFAQFLDTFSLKRL